MLFRPLAALLTLCLAASAQSADKLPRIIIAPDQRGFVVEGSGTPFRPWGFNYDHDREGRLIEDYWLDDWETVAGDFREMKALSANVVRIHLQYGRFMTGPNEADPRQLEQLARLLRLAEETGLYIDLTGLGCYHKAETPEWYVSMNEAQRWAAQETFWKAIATVGARSSAIFCYDIMNEPVAPGGKVKQDDWLPGQALGGKHFVQRITLEPAGRAAPEIAAEWTRRMAAAIRAADPRPLVTVGLVPWSLDRPGLKSGFVPEIIAPHIDFIAVHLYPKSKTLKEDMETLRGFNVGKPVVVEETFLLGARAAELEQFMIDAEAAGLAQGWIGFYWGKSIEEMTPPASIPEALTAQWLELFKKRAKAQPSR